MKGMSQILGGLPKYKWINVVKRNTTIESILRKEWKTIIGRYHQELHLSHVRFSTMAILANNPLWNTQIRHFESLILDRANAAIGRQTLKKISIVFDVDAVNALTSNTEKSSERSTKSLEELIQDENKAKRKQGMTLCSGCESVYVKNQTLCVFCQQTGC